MEFKENDADINETVQTIKANIANLSKVKRLSHYQSKYSFQFRVCLIGDAYVGKTSLLNRYFDNSYKENYINTIGCDFRIVSLELDNKKSKMQIWDTAGQERFKSISINYFRTAQGFIFVYDITKKDSFINILKWAETAFQSNKISVGSVLIGNKNDLENEREVSTEEGFNMARTLNLAFFEASAKVDNNCEYAFHYLNYIMVDHFSKNKIQDPYSENEEIFTKGKNLDTAKNKCSC